ncbi:hypothetical protein A2973_02340 [Candidatus Gottesmanbacteria bacterium RIFCSPLOWO2_01_FULL_49_10]|uniref:methionyl-tRNA formyltransferase n=1 Tax=Candidatus Gottesmanbacteria bacterium RIFCSPLOWO2_01_FULL_49_10 TaxID=1798396 RepID=A0A1F6AXW5_9BACT|nr:MAG: hypothetical protein A2973_02340 [Candidatus Gottesmanbacteria bacterium RIFCSPLOWO2_01_FULL_49_10]
MTGDRRLSFLFFGSTADSVIVLRSLCHNAPITCQAVITQPARPVGRRGVVTPTPVEQWAKGEGTSVVTFDSDGDKPWLFANEEDVVNTLQTFKADFLVTACFGQKIPLGLIGSTRFGGLNVHPSLLPHWRGADPVPWAILAGDRETGVTIATLSETFDTGRIIAQKKIAITDTDTSGALRTKLFTLGADLLVAILPTYLSTGLSPSNHHTFKGGTLQGSYARRLTRDDGFLPWELISSAIGGAPAKSMQPYGHIAIIRDFMHNNERWMDETAMAVVIERFIRALSPWPGIWTLLRQVRLPAGQGYGGQAREKRLKILACHVTPGTQRLTIDSVQLEGKQPVSYVQFAANYRSPSSPS